jgi:hypothetical protein
LIQELQTINVQLRIITEDNISHIENMAYSQNIDKLTLQPNTDMKQLIDSIRKKLNDANLPKPAPTSESPIAGPVALATPEVPYSEESPAFVPPEGSPESLPRDEYTPPLPPTTKLPAQGETPTPPPGILNTLTSFFAPSQTISDEEAQKIIKIQSKKSSNI